MFLRKPPALVRELQHAFKSVVFDIPKTRRILGQLVAERSWEQCRDSEGRPFDGMGSWATAPQPHGLGVRNQESAEFLRDRLFDNGDVRIWGDILPTITRPPGNPGPGDDPIRFYRVTTAATAKDRMLLRLMRLKPENYEGLCNGDFDSIRDAATAAGLISKGGGSQTCLESAAKLFGKLTEEQKLAFVLSLIPELDRASKEKLKAALNGKVEFSS